MVVPFMREVSRSLLFILHTEIIVKINCKNSHGHFRSTNFGDYSAFLCTRSKLAVQQLRAGAMTSSVPLEISLRMCPNAMTLLMLELHSLEEKT